MTRVLIIDDEESMLCVLSSILSREGYTPLQARDGFEGIRLCVQERPDLVITDLVMPNKEGIETIIELRRSFPRLKIIAMSGGGGIDPANSLRAAEALGADRSLRKPFRAKDLLTVISELLLSSPRRPSAPPPTPTPIPFEP